MHICSPVFKLGVVVRWGYSFCGCPHGETP